MGLGYARLIWHLVQATPHEVGHQHIIMIEVDCTNILIYRYMIDCTKVVYIY